MSRTIHLIESRPSELLLSLSEANAIISLGKALASKSRWWGTDPNELEDDKRAVITCSRAGDSTWYITVINAIGAFGVGDTTFIVEPKISIAHVIFLLARSNQLPRMDVSAVSIASANEFMELVARWFLEQVSEVASHDLIRDYRGTYGTVASVRGQIDAIPSAAKYYSGHLGVLCTYDDFTVDNALNRVLQAALRAVQASVQISLSIRREGRRLSSYFAEVGPLESRDSDVQIDRRSAHYTDALALAKIILDGSAISLIEGGFRAWTFLIRTPEAIEEGVRAVLTDGLRPEVEVGKFATALHPSRMSIEPDLRFEPHGFVGDVKYKKVSGEWQRTDLYQSVSFAAGARTTRSCVISFADQKVGPLPTVRFGDIEVSSIVWNANEEANPAESAETLLNDCRRWMFH